MSLARPSESSMILLNNGGSGGWEPFEVLAVASTFPFSLTCFCCFFLGVLAVFCFSSSLISPPRLFSKLAKSSVFSWVNGFMALWWVWVGLALTFFWGFLSECLVAGFGSRSFGSAASQLLSSWIFSLYAAEFLSVLISPDTQTKSLKVTSGKAMRGPWLFSGQSESSMKGSSYIVYGWVYLIVVVVVLFMHFIPFCRASLLSYFLSAVQLAVLEVSLPDVVSHLMQAVLLRKLQLQPRLRRLLDLLGYMHLLEVTDLPILAQRELDPVEIIGLNLGFLAERN